jgi:transcriptional regulator with XRE-family HTH domain
MSNKILQHLMADTRLSQTALSKATGVPQPTISRMLRGDTLSPRVSSVKKIAAHFNVTLDHLLGGAS